MDGVVVCANIVAVFVFYCVFVVFWGGARVRACVCVCVAGGMFYIALTMAVAVHVHKSTPLPPCTRIDVKASVLLPTVCVHA